MKNPFLEETFDRIKENSATAQKDFGQLNEEQLNWKPNEKSWSVGQCLHHLIRTNHLYLPILKSLASGEHKPSFFARIKFLSGFTTKFIMTATEPIPNKKTKTGGGFKPSRSKISSDILPSFIKDNEVLIENMKGLDGLDLDNYYISSPAAKIFTYNLKTVCKVLANHQQRHFHQARSVMEMEGFPK